ncbi:ferrochelatase [Chlamydiifrater phoenicopteri]|uniref:ferrochelatase n=1 Tax=Chlamydiifrater phoenicopteri TaxID=2681469 RepID=UPI001BD0828A|nr:ferrochelatase [Chlamydiifrater phoenicopteri]
MTQIYVLANFGGPRSLDEIEPFLTSLLTDPYVTGKIFSEKLTKKLFTWIAKKRTPKVIPQYAAIGGFSPIVKDTLTMSQHLERALCSPVIPFHRYLPHTYEETFSRLQQLNKREVVGIPLFPHFTYCVTGSIVNFLSKSLPNISWKWITDFGSHTAFIQSWIGHLKEFFKKNRVPEDDCVLLFSFHGIPESMSKKGDPYASQCRLSFNLLSKAFPFSETLLSFQSRFGPSKWLQPYTKKVCQTLKSKKKHIAIVPLGFISDHLETLFEIENEYLPTLAERGYKVYRVPAIFDSPLWPSALNEIVQTSTRFCPKEIFVKGFKGSEHRNHNN